jgi:tetratricopeptide (TPR) repeat protein
VRHTLLSALSVPRRQRLHLRVGEAMEHVYRTRLEERSGDIAHHLYQSGAAADGEKTRRYLGMAARRALAAAAADKALILVDRALEEDEDLEPDERAGLLYLRGVAHRTLGDWKAAAADWEPALPALEAEGEAELVAEICESMSLQRMWDNEIEGARELIERGLRAVGDEPSAWRCRFLSSLGHAHSNEGDHESAERFITEAISLAEELGDEKLLAGVFVGRLYQGEHWVRARMQADIGERAIEVARRSGSVWDLATVMGAALMGNVASGRRARAEELVDELLPLALRTGHIGGEVHAIVYPPVFHVQRGELEAARAGFPSVIARWRELEIPWTSVALAMAGLVELWLGERERCLALMEEAVSHEVTRTFSGYERAHLFLARAHFDHPEAAALMNEQSHRLPVAGVENPVGKWVTGIATVEAATILGKPDVAAALYPCMTQLLDAGAFFPWMLGLTERFAGMAAAAGQQWDLAERHFESALRQAEEFPHRVEAPHVQRWHAHMLLQRDAEGDPVRARALLDSARASYDELGMGMYAKLVESLVESMG